MGKQNAMKLIKNIVRESKDSPSYHTGLLNEHIIVSAYNSMSVIKLEKLRYILNSIIKKKKEYKRVQESQQKK